MGKNVSRPFKKPASNEKNAKDVVMHVASLKPPGLAKVQVSSAKTLESRKQVNLLESLDKCDENKPANVISERDVS